MYEVQTKGHFRWLCNSDLRRSIVVRYIWCWLLSLSALP